MQISAFPTNCLFYLNQVIHKMDKIIIKTLKILLYAKNLKHLVMFTITFLHSNTEQCKTLKKKSQWLQFLWK
jgi:hypothetical protein